MKTEFNVHIYKHGTNNDAFLTMIGNHNDGKCNISLNDFIGYIHCRVAMYPAIDSGKFKYGLDDENKILDITEDGGKTWTLQISEVEIHQLQEDNINDLMDVL